MRTYVFEAWHGPDAIPAGGNWGKFLVGVPDEEWTWTSGVPGCGIPGFSMVGQLGWTDRHVWVCDLQTGEGAFFKHGGHVPADLEKHGIWVCPMFEPWLTWFYTQDISKIAELPQVIELPEAEFSFQGYRRGGVFRAFRRSEDMRTRLAFFAQGFIERHWPKNDTAAHGGAPTPGRGEAMKVLGMFFAELFRNEEAEPGPAGE